MLHPDEYTPGRTLRHPDAGDVDVRDTIVTGGGAQYLVVAPDDSDFCGLLPVGVLRDEETNWEATDPDEVRASREEARNTPQNDSQEGDVTDATGVTDPGQRSEGQNGNGGS